MTFLDNHFRLYGGSTNDDAEFARMYNSKVSNKLSMLNSNFGRQIQLLDNAFNSNQAIMRSQIIATDIENVLDRDHIYEVNRFNYRSTNETMKKYIVSHPRIYRRVKNQSVEGYSNTGFELTNKTDNPRHRDSYTEVISSGIIDSSSVFRQKFITSKESTLSSRERMNIYKTWLNVLDALGDDIDMTDI